MDIYIFQLLGFLYCEPNCRSCPDHCCSQSVFYIKRGEALDVFLCEKLILYMGL